jgi:hypothetical protein
VTSLKTSISNLDAVPALPAGTDLSPEIQKRAIELIFAGLGQAELELSASYPTPLYWVLRDTNGLEQVKSGTAFFLDTGEATFGVTAAHVVTEYFRDTKSPTFRQIMIGANGGFALPIVLGDRVIDASEAIDIATFRVSREEISRLNRNTLRGYVKSWPPAPTEPSSPAIYCGFPGVGRRWVHPKTQIHGMVTMAGLVTNVSDTCISIQIEREQLFQIFGDRKMPENFDFGGMSGGPVLSMVQRPDLLRFWKPTGVVFQGPNPTNDVEQSIEGLEIIRIRPIQFIKPDGMLDLERWAQSNPLA